ncbi:MAG: hypothetical protein IJB64_03910 [Akkermansia sp.]|nr:hypothetical protein [Akkermansia sp.]
MKLHLPKLLLTALLTAVCASASHADDSASLTLGDVMYVGDSITHGVNSASYRWSLHKIFVDNGVSYTETGYHTGSYSDNANDDFTPSGDSYRGVEFTNSHSANASQRAYNTAGRTDTSRLNHTSIQNWLGVSTVDDIDPKKTMNGGEYSGSVSTPDTFVLLLGTNDLLSDYKNNLTDDNLATVTNNLLGADNKSGDMGTIVDTMYQSNPNATVYVSSIPCWTLHENNNNNNDREHAAVATYNVSLKSWVSNYNAAHNKNIVLVDVNRGMLDVASSTLFYGVSSMFNNPGVDGLHPNAQGDLIIAGNMARAMGIAGRTAGAERKAAEDFSHVVTNDGSNLKLTTDAPTLSFSWSESDSALTPAAGFTAELMGFTFGNGEYNTLDTTNNFTFTIGNGSNLQGSLSINEAYIQWGSTILFSENMSTLTENIRMAYITGDSANGINSGFYVWLGDMLIGEALDGTETSTALNGVSISYSGTSYYTLQGVAMDSTEAYAPTYGLFNNPAENGGVVIPNNVNWTNPILPNGINYIYASNNTSGYKGDVWVKVDEGQAKGWAAAQGNSGSTDGNITMIFEGAFKGCYDDDKANDKAGTVFGAVNSSGGVDGNVTIQLDAANAKVNSFAASNSSSIVGAYESTITGTFKAVVNAGTFTYDILGGLYTGSSHYIGATEIYINGGNIEGSVYGGGYAGRIKGDTYVAVSGGTIEGDIYAGGKGDTIEGNTCVTISGNTAAIKGDTISGGGYSGSIQGSSTVIIKNVSSENAVTNSIVTFDGTLTGGNNVTRASTLIFDNAQLTGKPKVVEFDSISLSGASNVSLGQTSLTGAASTIFIKDNSELAVTGDFTTAGGLTIEGGAGSLILSGSTNTFGGGISVAAGNTLNLGGDVTFNNIDVSHLTYTYDPEYAKTAQTNGLGNAIVTGLTAQDLIAGDGTVIIQEGTTATVNNLGIGYLADLGENDSFVVDKAIYYVMYSPTTNSKTQLPAYSLGNDTIIPMDNVVTVGNHSYSGPEATEGANEAYGFYVGQYGVLCIVGDSQTMKAEKILASAQGNGDIIVRSPGYQSEHDGTTYTYELTLREKTNVTGNLYLSPIVIGSDSYAVQQIGANLILEENADISSFKSVLLGHGETSLIVNGYINNSRENAGHINNLAMKGSSRTMLYVNENANEHLILGGDTCIRSYQHDSGGRTYANFNIEMNRNGKITIEHLTSEDDVLTINYQRVNTILNLLSSSNDKYDTNQNINATLDILSFDFRGSLAIYAYKEGSLHINVTLANIDQKLYDYQYFRGTSAATYLGDQTLTIKGSGTYILSEGNSIKDNFGLLSTEYAEDGVTRIWTGTVEVNNLVANDKWNSGTTKNGLDFSLYGNEQSTVHFKGFKGHLFNTTDNKAYLNITIAQDLILENSSTMNAYEIADGYSGQVQTYTGDISGTGDFVVSAASNMTFNLQGNLSEWKDGAELKVTAGTQAVNFSNKATVINADVLATNGATMNADISNTKAVTVNGKVKADGGTLNLSVNTAQGTTFTNEVNVTKISVGSGSTAKLKAASSAGKVSIGSYGEGKATLSDGLTIEENTVGHGYIADAKISHIQEAGTVELVEVSASNLYLYGGKPVQFHSTDSKNQFTFDKQITYGSERVNEVVFTSEIFRGMILSKDGAQLTLTVDNAVVWDDAVQPDWTNVTIELKGFTIEQLAGKAGDWDWDKFGLSFDTNSASVATLDNAALSTTVSDLLNDKYEFVKYEQSDDGLIIRMYNTPEPTTATLSMLALAALAARRRRRK